MKFKECSIMIVSAYEQHTNAFLAVISVLVLGLDYVTGRHIEFPIVYSLPVGLSAWKQKYRLAIGMGISFPILRVLYYFPWHEQNEIGIALINAPIQQLALLILAYLLNLIANQKILLEKKINILEDIIPMCASCKRIRNENNEYMNFEKYLIEHSETKISHGICKDCAKKLYPEYYKEE